MATTTLPVFAKHGAAGPVWRIADRGASEDRFGIDRLPKAR
ncbi:MULTISPECIES: hypothetical protein [unclassified Streptomyces]